jgi:hypothetical protein
MVRLLPDTASKCVRSVASKASCRSGGIREVSPTTSPGSRARASGASPDVASRSPARRPPAVRCTVVGRLMIRGGPSSALSTAANRSSAWSGGASRPPTCSRVEGSSRCHGAADALDAPTPPEALDPPNASDPPDALLGPTDGTMTRTGVRITVTAPPGAVTRVASASRTTDPAAIWSPRTRGRVGRGSEVSVNSTVTYAYWSARTGSGPRRRSAPCSPAEAAPAAAQSSIAATAVLWGQRRL